MSSSANLELLNEGLRHKQLLLPWCKSCGKCHFYPRAACPHCWGEEYDWRPSRGTGTVYTFTIVRANPPTAFRDKLPYAIAVIDLDEGVRLMTNIIDPPQWLTIGSRVQLEVVERGGRPLPLFRVQR